jgi:hypothetical protein
MTPEPSFVEASQTSKEDPRDQDSIVPTQLSATVTEEDATVHARPKSARPTRDSTFPIASDFSDFGSECGYESDMEALASDDVKAKSAEPNTETIMEGVEQDEGEIQQEELEKVTYEIPDGATPEIVETAKLEDIESEFGPDTTETPSGAKSSKSASLRSLLQDQLEEEVISTQTTVDIVANVETVVDNAYEGEEAINLNQTWNEVDQPTQNYKGNTLAYYRILYTDNYRMMHFQIKLLVVSKRAKLRL